MIRLLVVKLNLHHREAASTEACLYPRALDKQERGLWTYPGYSEKVRTWIVTKNELALNFLIVLGAVT